MAKSKKRGLASIIPPARLLLKTRDHSEPISVSANAVGASGERWVEPFLIANQDNFRRLSLTPEVQSNREGTHVRLRPGPRIGAVPLLSPSTRRVVAGVLVEPRFQWASLGAVFGSIGFSVEPHLGDAPLVPGSAREVPPWLLAGPVIERIAAMLHHRKRGFVNRAEERSSPRGRVDWSKWVSTNLPHGQWATFTCHFSAPDDDPSLMAAVRWTLAHLDDSLIKVAGSLLGRMLRSRIQELLHSIGPGATRRPPLSWSIPGASGWLAAAIQAMSWVAEERGLAGARNLDGLAWDLSIDAVWEAWVAAFSGDLARQLGMRASPFQTAKRSLHWSGMIQSMGSLVPDVELRNSERVVWIDAKYKRHMELLARHGWGGLSTEVKEAHRADLHQALAYASLADTAQVDTLLVYPSLGDEPRNLSTAATVTSGRRVRLLLASSPFGYQSPAQKEQHLRGFREILAL